MRNCIVIEAAKENIKITRILEGVTVDRYTTMDLTQMPKRDSRWIRDVVALCSQGSARVEVNIPPTPELIPTAEETLKQSVTALGIRVEQLQRQLAAASVTGGSSRGE